MVLIIYVDVLIFSNIVIDYILLFLTGTIANRKYKNSRIIIAAVLAGFSSLYIFFDVNISAVNIIVKILLSAVIIILIAFSFSSVKSFIIESAIFLALSFSLYGLFDCLQNLSASFVYTNNFVSYINISPITLVLLSVFFYVVIKMIYKFIDRKSIANKVELVLTLFNNEFKMIAIVDTGHTLTDPISLAQIVILDTETYEKIICTDKELKSRARLIPTKTISGTALLEGIRCDLMRINFKDNLIEHKNPIIIKSKERFNSDYKAIISKSAIN